MGIAFGVIIFVLLTIALILFLRRRGNREDYAPVQPDAPPVLPPVAATPATREVGASSYAPAVRGGYRPAPADDPYRSTLRRPVGTG